MLLILFFSMGLWCLIWIHAEYSDFTTKTVRLRAEYIAAQKQMIKTQVDQVITYIETMRSQAEAEHLPLKNKRIRPIRSPQTSLTSLLTPEHSLK